MSKGHDFPDMQNDGHVTLEMMIPGNKAGIVIGKGGETIKLLQVVDTPQLTQCDRGLTCYDEGLTLETMIPGNKALEFTLPRCQSQDLGALRSWSWSWVLCLDNNAAVYTLIQ